MRIQVTRDNNEVKAQASGKEETILAWTGEYAKGDRIIVDGLEKDTWYRFKADDSLEEALIYVKEDSFVWPVPFYEKKANRNPLSFLGARHYLSIRRAESWENSAYRNLALNPADQHDIKGVYPHATANVETRGESVFSAQNAIDGYKASFCHGEWPYQSWGINRQLDAALTIEFGLPVNVDNIRLYLRADFPHDAWWDEVTILCSDGSIDRLKTEQPTGAPQIFPVRHQGITALTLCKMHPHDHFSPFPALTQIEVYGKPAE